MKVYRDIKWMIRRQANWYYRNLGSSIRHCHIPAGFGGRKGNKKQNDSASTADMESYKPGRFEDSRGSKRPAGAGGKFGGGGAKGGVRSGGVKKVAKKGKIRPGKEKRAAMKGKN